AAFQSIIPSCSAAGTGGNSNAAELPFGLGVGLRTCGGFGAGLFGPKIREAASSSSACGLAENSTAASSSSTRASGTSDPLDLLLPPFAGGFTPEKMLDAVEASDGSDFALGFTGAIRPDSVNPSSGSVRSSANKSEPVGSFQGVLPTSASL